jgi:hypothetical protein
MIPSSSYTKLPDYSLDEWRYIDNEYGAVLVYSVYKLGRPRGRHFLFATALDGRPLFYRNSVALGTNH